jgi:hypothetical protein
VNRRAPISALLVGIALPTSAVADHSHHHDAEPAASPGSAFSAKLGVLAASYAQTSFVGDYQGVTPELSWTNGRFAASTMIGAYRLRKNGALYHGVGDLFVHGQATIVGRAAASVGVVLALSAPTGSQRDALGMGHFMVMPALWGTWTTGAVTLAASGGYGHAIGADSDAEHAHGTGPIVDPMNLSELTWSASGDLAVARALRLGARIGGAITLDDGGVDRTIGAVRAVWTEGRVETAAEVQVGIAGDPFRVRGVVETALRF